MNLKEIIADKTRRLKEFFDRYEHRIGFGFLIAGFIFDNFTLKRIDFFLDNLVLLTYLAVIAVCIVLIDLGIKKVSYIAPYAMQFAMGGLFSGYVIFYFRSASLTISWPFLLMLLVFFIGNEFFRRHYEVLIFRIAIFFVAVFSYFIFSLPVLFHRLGADVFILSGVLSLAVIAGLTYLIKRLAHQHTPRQYGLIATVIGGIYLVFNLFYFTNIIPPIPLALKDVGIYHRVERVLGDYVAQEERRPWYDLFGGDKIRLVSGTAVYGYSAVFAPTALEGEIFHRWSFYDDATESWVEMSRISFLILGGRDGGYRGYSIQQNITPGRWRLDVVTARNQIIGRTTFRILEAKTPPVLQLKTL